MASEISNPLSMLSSDLDKVRHRHSPVYSADQFLQALSLDGPDPDGLTLSDRFAPYPSNAIKRFFIARQVYRSLSEVQMVINRISKNQSTPEDEIIARTLGTIAAAQIVRENNICPDATVMAAHLMQSRPEYISLPAQTILKGYLDENMISVVISHNQVTIYRGLPPEHPNSVES